MSGSDDSRRAVLYAESFAPWCETARWALDHHGVSYRCREHIAMLGEVALRVAGRRLFGRVTVPLFVDGPVVLMDSVAIARHAERRGQGAPLFPPSEELALASWIDSSQAVMTSGRAMLLPRMSRSPDALREQLPHSIPGLLRPVLQPVAAAGVAHLMRKYAVRAGDEAHHESVTRQELDGLRAALAGGRDHLLGDRLSFADIAMAVSLQFVMPVADRYIPLGTATRAVWTHPALAADYNDLLAWRDRLYDSGRP